MALNIKDAETEQLAAEVAALAGETKTRAVKIALQERKERLAAESDASRKLARLRWILESEIWPQIPESVRGRPLSKAEREEILGYGPEGF
jgi:antitoxin VapB